MTIKERKTAATNEERTPRVRDASATTKRIVDAATRLLAEKGFTGLGVNAVAAAAGVDKQLIYYYFGGLDGVIRQLGTELEFWLGAPLRPLPDEPYGEAVSRLLLEYADALRRNALVLRLLAWELVEPTDALKELEVTRSKAMEAWVAELRGTIGTPPAGVDAPAVNAVLLAGLHYLTLRQQSIGTFAGVDIGSAEGAARIAKAIDLIATKVYGADVPAAAAKRRRP